MPMVAKSHCQCQRLSGNSGESAHVTRSRKVTDQPKKEEFKTKRRLPAKSSFMSEAIRAVAKGAKKSRRKKCDFNNNKKLTLWLQNRRLISFEIAKFFRRTLNL
jgi:hypothetical protein